MTISQRCRGNHRRRGFSLVELLIVIALIVTLGAILAPLLLPSPARALQAGARDVATALRESRREARAMHPRRYSSMDTETGAFGTAGGPQQYTLPDGVQAELTTAQSLSEGDSTGRIAFFPDGSASGGRVRLAAARHALQVDVEWLNGRIRISEAER